MNFEQVWKVLIEQLQGEVSHAIFEGCLRGTRAVNFEDGVMTVGVASESDRSLLQDRLERIAGHRLEGMLNRPVRVDFVVVSGTEEPEGEDLPQQEGLTGDGLPARRATRNLSLNPEYVFGNFVDGLNTRLAYAAAQAIAENAGGKYNPLYLCGGVGLGKTHLMHAIGNRCHERGLEVLYLPSEEFTNDLVLAIRAKNTLAFREKYRSADVLMVDDIQFIAGKEATQEEFFHTFNELRNQGKQIVISSDRAPKSMGALGERLRSRFEWGLIADITPPDEETRLAILRRKAQAKGLKLPEDVLARIAQYVQSNIRELEGALNRVVAFSELGGMPLNGRTAEIALEGFFLPVQKVAPERVITLVAEEYCVSVRALQGRNRAHEIAEPRQIAMYLLKQETDASLPEIGEVLGGKDHTTVLYGIKKITKAIATSKEVERKVQRIKQHLYAQAVCPA